MVSLSESKWHSTLFVDCLMDLAGNMNLWMMDLAGNMNVLLCGSMEKWIVIKWISTGHTGV